MVILRPVNLRWIQGAADDSRDLCAHGDIEFQIGNDVLLTPGTGMNRTVSAAALYLLRTLSVPHTKDAPVGDHLFPCCGFSMYDVIDQEVRAAMTLRYSTMSAVLGSWSGQRMGASGKWSGRSGERWSSTSPTTYLSSTATALPRSRSKRRMPRVLASSPPSGAADEDVSFR